MGMGLREPTDAVAAMMAGKGLEGSREARGRSRTFTSRTPRTLSAACLARVVMHTRLIGFHSSDKTRCEGALAFDSPGEAKMFLASLHPDGRGCPFPVSRRRGLGVLGGNGGRHIFASSAQDG